METTPRQKEEAQRRVYVACPRCRQGYRIPARLIGRRLVCRHCRNEWVASEIDPRKVRASGSSSRIDPPSDSGQPALPDSPASGTGSSSVAIDMSWVGRRMRRYKILGLLGRGGMGVVWRAHDDTLRRDVALKILNPARKHRAGSVLELNTELFLQEARAVAKLQHPFVVSIFEVNKDHNQIFLALELMGGGTLKEHVASHGPIPRRELMSMMIGPAQALALAHRRGIIHRDIKPGNLMFDDHGHLKLMDFGLADVAQEAASERIRGKAVGSLGWVAPETARGEPTTAVSDIYGFGLVMVYALTGRSWLRAETKSKLLELHQNPPEPDFSDMPGLTPMTERLLRRCLAVRPADRFANADELVQALQACAQEDPHARSRRRRLGASIAAVSTVFGLLIGGGIALYYLSNLNERVNEFSRPLEGIARAPAPAPPGSVMPSPVVRTPVESPPAERPGPDARVPWPEVYPDNQFKYVASTRGKVFHLASSKCGRDIFASNLTTYDSVSEALDDHRKPCRRCKPTQSRAEMSIVAAPDAEESQ